MSERIVFFLSFRVHSLFLPLASHSLFCLVFIFFLLFLGDSEASKKYPCSGCVRTDFRLSRSSYMLLFCENG